VCFVLFTVYVLLYVTVLLPVGVIEDDDSPSGCRSFHGYMATLIHVVKVEKHRPNYRARIECI